MQQKKKNYLYDLALERAIISISREYEEELIRILDSSTRDPRLEELLQHRETIIRLIEDEKTWEYTPYGFVKRFIKGYDGKQIVFENGVIKRTKDGYTIREDANADTKIHFAKYERYLDALTSVEKEIFFNYMEKEEVKERIERLKEENFEYSDLPQDYDEILTKPLNGYSERGMRWELDNLEHVTKYNGERIIIIVLNWLAKIDKFASEEEMLAEFMREFEVYIKIKEYYDVEVGFEYPETDRRKHYKDIVNFPETFLNLLSKYTAKGKRLRELYTEQMEYTEKRTPKK